MLTNQDVDNLRSQLQDQAATFYRYIAEIEERSAKLGDPAFQVFPETRQYYRGLASAYTKIERTLGEVSLQRDTQLQQPRPERPEDV